MLNCVEMLNLDCLYIIVKCCTFITDLYVVDQFIEIALCLKVVVR